MLDPGHNSALGPAGVGGIPATGSRPKSCMLQVSVYFETKFGETVYSWTLFLVLAKSNFVLIFV